VVQRREHLRFAPEARQALQIDRERIGQDLERDVAIELRVARAIDLPHSAAADRGEHVVRAKSGSGLQRHLPGVVHAFRSIFDRLP
jgi:hypothetical protein